MAGAGGSLEEKDSNRLLEQLNVLAAEALAGSRDDERLAAPEEVKLVAAITEEPMIEKPEPIIVEATPVNTDDKPAIDKTPAADTAAASTTTEIKVKTDPAPEPEVAIQKPETFVENIALNDGDLEAPKTGQQKIITDEPILLKNKTDVPKKTASNRELIRDKKSVPSVPPVPDKPRATRSQNPDILPPDLRALPPPSPEIAPTSKPRIFVSPRAPDDPGPDPAD